MTNDRKLMQMALDALEEAQDYTSCPTYSPSMTQQCAIAAVALRARLTQPEPEPVAWMTVTMGEVTSMQPHMIASEMLDGTYQLYTTPPQREWQGLTDEEMHECAGEYPWTPTGLKCCRAIEAKLKEKNT